MSTTMQLSTYIAGHRRYVAKRHMAAPCGKAGAK